MQAVIPNIPCRLLLLYRKSSCRICQTVAYHRLNARHFRHNSSTEIYVSAWKVALPFSLLYLTVLPSLPDNPLTARYQRDELGCHETTDKRTYRYNRNGSHGGQSQCRLKHRHPQAKPEYVHKEHAVAESRHFGNEARRLRNADATEQQKRACRQRHAIKGAESPSHLNDRRRMNHSRNSLDIERPYGSHRPDQHKQETDPQTQGTPPSKMHADIMCQHKVAQITREIP